MVNLVDELCFYRKYHYNHVNVAIHVVCIPMILLTSLWLSVGLHLPYWISEIIPSIDPVWLKYLNASVVAAIGYALFYARLDLLYGLPYGLFLVWSTIKFTELAPLYGSTGNKVAFGIWTGSWIAQFIGHGKFEHRAPALLDSLVQALVLAPFFAVFEVSHALGIRKHILDDIDKKVLPDIEKFHAARLTKST